MMLGGWGSLELDEGKRRRVINGGRGVEVVGRG